MKYRHLGRSGLLVSEIAYGSWRTATEESQEQSLACHLKAFEHGVTLFDTADIYQKGQAEEIVGRALRQLRRSAVVVATKCCGKSGDGPNDRGLSRKHIFDSCEGSLRRLGTDHIDLYQAHSWDGETPLAETVRAFDDLIRQGKVRYWGISNWSAVQVQDALALCEANGYDRPISHQPRYNLFVREVEQHLVGVCSRQGLGLICYSPLAKGLLTGKYGEGRIPAGSMAETNEKYREQNLKPYNLAAIEQLARLAEELGLSPSSLALAWLLSREAVSAAIVGARLPEQVVENVKASGVVLSAESLLRIQQILDLRAALIHEEDALALRKKVSAPAGQGSER